MYRHTVHRTRKASWMQVFDPVYTLWFDLYHWLRTNVHFSSSPIWVSRDWYPLVSSWRFRNPLDSKKLFVRFIVHVPQKIFLPRIHPLVWFVPLAPNYRAFFNFNFTHFSDPGLISACFRLTGSTHAGFQEAFRAVYSTRAPKYIKYVRNIHISAPRVGIL